MGGGVCFVHEEEHFDHNSHSHHYSYSLARAVHQVVSCVRSGRHVVPFGPEGLTYTALMISGRNGKWKLEQK